MDSGFDDAVPHRSDGNDLADGPPFELSGDYAEINCRGAMVGSESMRGEVCLVDFWVGDMEVEVDDVGNCFCSLGGYGVCVLVGVFKVFFPCVAVDVYV